VVTFALERGKRMAKDVQAIAGTPALIGARLSNFPTATSALLRAHLAWLDRRERELGRRKTMTGIGAVEADVFGFQPPNPIAKPSPTPPTNRFKIRVVVGATGTLPYFDGPQAGVYYFEMVDVVRRMRSLFGYGGGGLAIPTLLPAFLSIPAVGPFTDFTTTVGPCRQPLRSR